MMEQPAEKPYRMTLSSNTEAIASPTRFEPEPEVIRPRKRGSSIPIIDVEETTSPSKISSEISESREELGQTVTTKSEKSDSETKESRESLRQEIIYEYFSDIIRKSKCSTNSRNRNHCNKRGDERGYILKARSSSSRSSRVISFIKDVTERTYFNYFAVDRDHTNHLLPTLLETVADIKLDELLIDSANASRTSKKGDTRSGGRLGLRSKPIKRHDYNSQKIPKLFLSFFSNITLPATEKVKLITNLTQASPLRKPKNSSSKGSSNLSKYSPDSDHQSSPELKDKEANLKRFNMIMNENKQEDWEADPLDEPMMARLYSVQHKARKFNIGSLKDFKGPNLLSGYCLSESKPYELSKDAKSQDLESSLKRMNSTVEFLRISEGGRKVLSKFEASISRHDKVFTVLEHKVKKGAILSLMIIFNDSTTLKLRLMPSSEGLEGYSPAETSLSHHLNLEDHNPNLSNFSNIGNHPNHANHPSDPNHPDHPDHHAGERKYSANATSISSLENAMKTSNGKYRIMSTKPLMFAKDHIRKKLFAFSIEYVKKYFWYNTLQRYLELVDRIYQDLLHSYHGLLKELNVGSSAAKIEDSQYGPAFVIAGESKGTKMTVCCPLKHPQLLISSFEENKEQPPKKKKKISSRPIEELFTSSPIEQLKHFKQFIE